MADKLKAVLYYTLVGRWGGGCGYSVMAVTSETGRDRINGRLLLEHGGFEPTHARKSDKFGRFDSEQAARDKIAGIVAIREKYEPLIKVAQKELVNIRARETREIQEILRIDPNSVQGMHI